jgi:3-phenylpropionate/trans-cinnamate dioxygenase ferredoxin reductase component
VSDGVVIVGAGLAGQRCAETLRASGFDGPIRMAGDELFAPYDRPPLSKDLLRAETAHELVALRPDGWHAANGVGLLTGRRAVALDPQSRTITLDDGSPLRGTDVVIATGARPRTLPLLEGAVNAFTLRTLVDARALGAALAPGARLVVAGAGFVGLEVAATARVAGVEVTVVEAAPAPLARVLGATVGRALAERHRREGVDVRTDARIVAAHTRRDGRVTSLMLASGERLGCDAVLVAVGTAPAAAWVGRPAGVLVDGTGRAAWPGVWAAGDVALSVGRDGRAVRTEHWESAARQGVAVARAILGRPLPPVSPPAFWSDQFGTRVHFVGGAEGHDAVAVDGDVAAGDATVLYLKHGRAVGGLLVGRPRDLPRLRARVAAAIEPEEVAA